MIWSLLCGSCSVLPRYIYFGGTKKENNNCKYKRNTYESVVFSVTSNTIIVTARQKLYKLSKKRNE